MTLSELKKTLKELPEGHPATEGIKAAIMELAEGEKIQVSRVCPNTSKTQYFTRNVKNGMVKIDCTYYKVLPTVFNFFNRRFDESGQVISEKSHSTVTFTTEYSHY